MGFNAIAFPDPREKGEWVVARPLTWTRHSYAMDRAGNCFKQRRDGSWKLKGQRPEGGGYMQTAIDGKMQRISRILCRLHHGEPPSPDDVAMHIDNDRGNNTPRNLKWGSQRENIAQAVREGRNRARGLVIATPRGRRGEIARRQHTLH